jgi:hypothetical protein
MLAGHPKKKEREMLNIVSEKAGTCRGKIIGGEEILEKSILHLVCRFTDYVPKGVNNGKW